MAGNLYIAKSDGYWWSGHTQGPAWSASTPTQPTGPGIVRYQDLYVSGDTLSGTLARLTSPAQVSFPDGTFQMVDFADSSKYGCLIPANCTGILGSGIGFTIFQIQAGSSTQVGQVPAQSTGQTNPLYIFRTSPSPSTFTAQGFTINGTDQPVNPDTGQPHAYGGFMFDHVGTLTVTDCQAIGIPGSANSPPGETFAWNNYGCTNSTATRVETDGRNSAGVRRGASPWGNNSAVNHTWDHCYFHHSLTSMPTSWQHTGTLTSYYLRSEYNGTGSGLLSSHGINHERVSGPIRHYNPSIILDGVNGNSGKHMSLNSNGGYGDNQDVQVIDATFDVFTNGTASPLHAGCFALAMNTTYQGGPNEQVTWPSVLSSFNTGATVDLVGMDGGVSGATNGAAFDVNYIVYR